MVNTLKLWEEYASSHILPEITWCMDCSTEIKIKFKDWGRPLDLMLIWDLQPNNCHNILLETFYLVSGDIYHLITYVRSPRNAS